MKKILGVFITISIFVLNFINMAFANPEKISKPPRYIKDKASNGVNLQTGKPIPANKTNLNREVYPKVETNFKGKVFPKAEMNLQEEVFPKVEMDHKFD